MAKQNSSTGASKRPLPGGLGSGRLVESGGCELVISGSPAPAGRARIEHLQAPAPGTYWRVRDNVPGCNDDRMETNPLRRGLVLMLASVEYADGAPHAYSFAPHPSWREEINGGSRVHADDFYIYFEPAPDAEQVRARELARLLGDMDETKRLMMAPPPDAVPAGLLTHDPAAAIGGEGRALATPDQLQSMTQYAEMLQRDAEKRSTWIQKHSGTLGQQGTLLANFHQERAQAALARASSQLEGVKGILKTVENLRLYTGAGVELLQLRNGVPAAPGAKVTIYQDVLSLDEEALILLDKGGLDHVHTNELVRALADPELLCRLIPAERGIVLVKFRNSYKEFITVSEKADAGTQLGAALYNSEMSAESQRKRLLVRDGDRLWLVDVDAVLKHIDQLMPSAGEQAGYFERSQWGQKPKRITRDDLDYAKAQREQIGALDRYGQVLIVLWGLHDRADLFEASAIPKFSNWLDPAFQKHFLALVSLDTLIGVERPSFSAWQQEQNQYLVAGSWVAVLWNEFSQVTAPGAYSNGSYDRHNSRTHYETLYKPDYPADRDAFIERARADKEGLYIEVPCVYCGYGDVRRKNVTVKMRIKTDVRVGDGVLALDRIRAADLGYYLQSRQQRKNYAQYVQLFREARTWVNERDAAEAPLRATLRDAVRQARLAHDPSALDSRITDALAIARTARRDKSIPAPGTAPYRSFVNAAMAALHANLVDNTGRVAAIDAWAAAHEREPLRLVLTGKNIWKLYLVPVDAEHDARLGPPAHTAIAEVSFEADGSAAVAVCGRQMLRAVAGEQVLHDWNREVQKERKASRIAMPEFPDPFIRDRAQTQAVGAAEWLQKVAPFQVDYAEAVDRLDAAIAHSAAFDLGMDLVALVAECKRWMREKSKGQVVRMSLRFAIGSGLRRDTGPVVLCAVIDALTFAFHAGNEDIKEACRKVTNGIYARPDGRIRELGKAPEWNLARIGIDAVGPIQRATSVKRDLPLRWIGQNDCMGPGKKPDGQDRVTVMAITPAGVRLLPWLAEYTRRGLG